MKVNVRFAPSPTGFLHVGGLRTALYNYLFAKQHNGNFILRIEDTDQSRKVEGAVSNIIDSLNKCGITFNQGPDKFDKNDLFIQSNRIHIYNDAIEYLLDNGYAYICLDDDYKKYKDQNISLKELTDKLYHVRLKIPNDELNFHDMIRGDIMFDLSLIDDPVILKSDGFPTYHLANVIDDHDMQISHVIRGEEWLPSTPIHILIYKYFKWELPNFVHLPLLLNSDKSKLSKRQGHVAVEDFLNEGYLPEALINFIALLGWNSKKNNEIFSIDELISQFNIKNIQKSGAVFDLIKLRWMNGQYLKKIDVQNIMPISKKIFEKKNWFINEDSDFIEILNFAKERSDTVESMIELIYPFFEEPEYNIDYLDMFKNPQSKEIYSLLINEINNLDKIEGHKIKDILSEISSKLNIKGKDLFFPVRFAIWGDVHGPDIGLLIKILDKSKTLNRLSKALNYGK